LYLFAYVGGKEVKQKNMNRITIGGITLAILLTLGISAAFVGSTTTTVAGDNHTHTVTPCWWGDVPYDPGESYYPDGSGEEEYYCTTEGWEFISHRH
jgi:hypothetical protein